MIIVGRAINGISLNGLEYILNDDGSVMQFENRKKAETFLKGHGATESDFDELIFVEEDKNV